MAEPTDPPSIAGVLTEHFPGFARSRRRWYFLRCQCAVCGSCARFLERYDSVRAVDPPCRLDLACARLVDVRPGRFGLVGPRLPRTLELSAPDQESDARWRRALSAVLQAPACTGLGVEDAVAIRGGRCSPSASPRRQRCSTDSHSSAYLREGDRVAVSECASDQCSGGGLFDGMLVRASPTAGVGELTLLPDSPTHSHVRTPTPPPQPPPVAVVEPVAVAVEPPPATGRTRKGRRKKAGQTPTASRRTSFSSTAQPEDVSESRRAFVTLFEKLAGAQQFITCESLAPKLGADKAAKLIQMADTNSDGAVSLDEWLGFIGQSLAALSPHQTVDTAQPEAVAHFTALFGGTTSPVKKKKVKRKRKPGSKAGSVAGDVDYED
eukprot:TRINITY_DN33213_c0_g1_i1.p1 TRINITY_DN33213_c0_g1~~TRINITY_DN33213_c0_g1_i1.p1  ORF type:complete len:408 (+),score=80.33 TRINITY_DN33213_c0_g1_i1:85-1224(+)